MWPFRRRNKKEIMESEQAILEAQKHIHQAQARNAEVHKISGSLRVIRERNHFAEQLRLIMEGR